MNTAKDQISPIRKASLGRSTTNPTQLDHQKGPEVHGQSSCTEQKTENFPIQQKGCRDKNPKLQAERGAARLGCPTTCKYREMQQSLVVQTGCVSYHTAALLDKVQLKTGVSMLKCLHRDVDT